MSESDRDALSRDVLFDMLSSPRRRYVLHYLHQAGGRAELGELADHVAAWENDTTIEQLGSQERKRVYISLYQTHVPKLDEVGVVEYDQSSGVVDLADRADELAPYLSEESGNGFPWGTYYLVLAAASAALFVGVALNAPVLGGIPELVAALVVTAAFAVSAIAHYVLEERSRGPTGDLPDVEEDTRN